MTDWTGTNGWYESSDGHIVNSIGRRWFITCPGETHPDVEKSSLRDAKAYVEQYCPCEGPFGVTCIDCGERIDDVRPYGNTNSGDLIHLDCGDPMGEEDER